MQLVYSHSHDGNFGDDLNAILWPRLFPNLDEAGGRGAALVGVGTIIGMPVADADHLHVLSSGVGYDRLANWSGKTVRYWSVRGHLTAKLLGLPAEKAIGDGAYLMPLVAGTPTGPKSQRAIVIPHLDSIRIGGWAQTAALAGFDLVDPRGDPMSVIGKIAAAPLVLTESLHGAILADAFGVDWLPFATSRNFSAFKWADWLSTLEKPVAITALPPPRPQMWASHGRRRAGLDAEIAAYLNGEISFGGAEGRDGEGGDNAALKRRLKIWVSGLPGAGQALGAHPARTAEGLARLAERDPIPASPTRVASMQARLLEVAEAFSRETGAALSPSFL